MFIIVCSYFLLSCFFIQNIHTFDVPFDVESFDGYDINVGNALLLTPLLQQNKTDEALNAAKVSPFLGEDISYSGFLTVDEKLETNLHFWFFPAKENWENSTTVVWFHTGTGVSCIEGLFTSNGPYGFSGSYPVPRKFSWTDHFNLLCLDAPVGSGYSFTKYRKGYSQTAKEVAQNAAEGLHQFYQLFPVLKRRTLILSGESLAGQFIPYIVYFLHHDAYKKRYNVPFKKRIFVGNPTLNLGSQFLYSDYFYFLGLIGKTEKEMLLKQEIKIKLFKQSGKFDNATDTFCRVFCPAYTRPDPTLFETLTGLDQNSNFINYCNHNLDLSLFLNDPSTREKLHVGNIRWKKDRSVFDILKKTVFEPTKVIGYEHVYEYVLQQQTIPTLMYVGQNDLVVPPLALERGMASLSWKNAGDYDYSVRTKLFYNGKLVGYYKASFNTISVVIRNAGHNAAADRPGYVKAILKDFDDGVFDHKGDARARD